MPQNEDPETLKTGPKGPLSYNYTIKRQTAASDLLAGFVAKGGDLEWLAKELQVSAWTVYRWARGITEPPRLYWRELTRTIEAQAA